MNTGIENLIERLQALHSVIPTNTKENRAIKGAYVHAIMIAKEYATQPASKHVEDSGYSFNQVLQCMGYAASIGLDEMSEKRCIEYLRKMTPATAALTADKGE